uniref:Ig-like domain-containing protein n=2 Tax=Monopterus albus TaxID=43700 RepID=A0A3Q3QZL9_MONAL
MLWFFVFSGFLACTGKSAGTYCPIEMKPSKVVVRYGEPLRVNCTSLTQPIEGMGWESTAGGTGLIEGVSSCPLTIASVTDWNIAPKCYINMMNDAQCLERLPVTVYKTPDSVSLSGQTGPMEEGKQYLMQCDVANVAPASNLYVYWHKGKERFNIGTFNDTTPTPVNRSSTVTLTAHRDHDGTQIWCEARLHFMPTAPDTPAVPSKSHKMIVLYPPTFIKPETEMLEIKAGNKITLDCTAKGNPMPVYTWRFPHPQQMNMNQSETQLILIPSFQLPGYYNCTASNSQGIRTKYFIVTENAGNRKTFAAILVGFLGVAVLLVIVGALFVTPEGTFSFNKGGCQPTSSGVV